MHSDENGVVDARLAAVLASTGHSLTEAQIAQVRTRIEASLKQAAALRTVSLTNADEPEIVFAPFRGDA